jgi:hypothetical protein
VTKLALVSAASILALASSVVSQPGTLIGNVNLPRAGNGVSVAVDCNNPPTVYYTHTDARLYKMSAAGADLGDVPIIDSATGGSVVIDEMSFDFTRGANGVLWGGQHSTTPTVVWQIDPVSGSATRAFTSTSNSIGTFRDGLAFDPGADLNNPADDSIFLSGDVSSTIEEFRPDGTFIRQFTPQNAAGGTLGLISGVMVGRGDLLYLGRNGAVQIVAVRKSDGVFISSFASPGGARDEGLECDPISFAPRLALWSREFNSPGFMSVIELEPDTCTCGGAQNTPPRFTSPTCGATIGGFIGGAITFTVEAVDPDSGDTLTLSQTGAPAGSTFTPTLPTSGSSPVSSVFNWVPTSAGVHNITFTVTDGTDSATCTVRIEVAELCMLMLGLRPLNFPLPWSPNDVLRVDPMSAYLVTTNSVPAFRIPNDQSIRGTHVFMQIYMDNPINFPGDRYKVSDALDIELGVRATNYGTQSGMRIWLSQPPLLGTPLSVRFSIQ